MSPKITTIIPTYKRPKLLARAIQSALHQTIGDLEVLVHDNASGDETEQIVKRFQSVDRRVKYHRHSTNIGAVANFISALDTVTTPFFSLVSDDDVLLPEFYETALKGFANFPSAQFAATEVFYVESNGRFRGTSNEKYSSGLHRAPQGLVTMLNENHPPTWTGVLFRKEVIRDVGQLDLRVGASVDYDYLLRIAAQADFVIIPKPGAIFSIHENSTSALSDVHTIWPGMRYTMENIASISGLPEMTKGRAIELLKRQAVDKVYYFGRQAIKKRRFDLACAAAKILETELGASTWAHVLSVTAHTCNGFPFVLMVLNTLNKLNPIGKTRERSTFPAVEAAIQFMIGLEGEVSVVLS